MNVKILISMRITLYLIIVFYFSSCAFQSITTESMTDCKKINEEMIAFKGEESNKWTLATYSSEFLDDSTYIGKSRLGFEEICILSNDSILIGVNKNGNSHRYALLIKNKEQYWVHRYLFDKKSFSQFNISKEINFININDFETCN